MSGNDHVIVSVEEGREEGNVTEQASGTSSGNDQTTENAIIEERLKSLDGCMMNEEGDQEQVKRPVIPRVPIRLRENEKLKMFFEPRAVSIGPYHHGNQNLKVTEEMKLKLAAIFIKKYIRVDKKDLYDKIKGEIEELRKCYEPDAIKAYNDDDLAWMFLIDGCVVLHFFIWRTYKMDRAVTDERTFFVDLLLLENQLPFLVLKQLISSSEKAEDLMAKIQNTIRFRARVIVQRYNNLPQEDPAHLLDLMRKACITEFVRDHENSNFIVQIFKKLQMFKKLRISKKLSLMIKFLVYSILFPFILQFETIDVQTIQELIEFGIDLKSTTKNSVTDITFSHGTLKLPRIHIDGLTAFKFLNLIAYELGSNSSENLSQTSKSGKLICKGFEVSAYIFFLASIITQEEDVKQLRVNRILYNNLNSNKDVVELFQKISTANFPEGSRELHSSILEDMQIHCNKKYNVWRAQLRKRYFDSPWSVIAVVGAVIALSLTFLQTIYSVLGYHSK